jgi:hypothetical protein
MKLIIKIIWKVLEVLGAEYILKKLKNLAPFFIWQRVGERGIESGPLGNFWNLQG